MGGFVWSQFRHRPVRSAALALAVLVAAVGFTLLTASASTSALHVQGTLKSSFRPAYDILVRPKGAETKLERQERLVRPNFLSGLYGGISFKQWHETEKIRGVSVAAPIANVGYVLLFTNVTVPITHLVDKAPYQLYRISGTWIADDGLSRYPAPSEYVYYTPRDRFVRQADPYKPVVEVGPNARPPQPSCRGFNADLPLFPTSPFPSLASEAGLSCFPTTVPKGSPYPTSASFIPPTPTFVGTQVALYFPVYISAIDPTQEAKLVHLDHAIVAGRYLHADEGLSHFTLTGTNSEHFRIAPVLASSHTFVDEQLRLTVERLRIPEGIDPPRALATGTCTTDHDPCQERIPPPRGASFRTARQFVERLPGVPIATRTIGAGTVYDNLLKGDGKPWPAGTFGFAEYWTTSPTRYRLLGPDRLEPIAVDNPPDVWHSPAYGGFFQPPFDNLDTQFRQLHGRAENNSISPAGVSHATPVRVVGRFDPQKLPSFSPLTKVPLETYYPPELLPGDTAAQQALHGKPLRPNQNVGGYIQQPPLLLTTMQGLQAFLDPHNWIGGGTMLSGHGAATAIPHAQREAPISAIRVKVAGVTGPDPLSLTRIRVVAQKIHDATGLAVDITAGSSPHPVLISLPKGKFGRPGLFLREGWSKKGATVSFLRALDRKDLALFALILVICGFFLGNGALASVRARRAEIGTLLTLGWTRRAIFRAVLAELAAVGLIAGAVGTGLAAALVEAFALRLPLLRVLLVLPIAVLLSIAAGAIPAWLAARGLPLDALRPPVTARRRGRPVRRLAALALVNLTRLPARTLVGASGLAIGVAALAVLVGIERAFQGTLVGTLLGNAVSLQVRGADFAAVGVTIALAALSVADVVYLNLRERQAELVTLRTLGWSNAHVRTTVLLESLGLGLLGSIGGAVLAVLIGGLVLAIPLASLVLAALAAAGGGIAAALLASLVPISQVVRLTVPSVLATE